MTLPQEVPYTHRQRLRADTWRLDYYQLAKRRMESQCEIVDLTLHELARFIDWQARRTAKMNPKSFRDYLQGLYHGERRVVVLVKQLHLDGTTGAERVHYINSMECAGDVLRRNYPLAGAYSYRTCIMWRGTMHWYSEPKKWIVNLPFE
jgi:hypothetical protein